MERTWITIQKLPENHHRTRCVDIDCPINNHQRCGCQPVDKQFQRSQPIFKKPQHEGVKVAVEDNRVYLDIYVILKREVNIKDVCQTIQQQVARAISETVGMDVGNINVHVEDIEYSES